MNINIQTQITITINDKTFTLTQQEAYILFNNLKKALSIQEKEYLYNPWITPKPYNPSSPTCIPPWTSPIIYDNKTHEKPH